MWTWLAKWREKRLRFAVGSTIGFAALAIIWRWFADGQEINVWGILISACLYFCGMWIFAPLVFGRDKKS